MKIKLLLLALTIGALSSTVFAESPAKGKLLLSGSFHGDEVSAKSGESWFALIKKENTYIIEKKIIEISLVFDAVLDKDESKKTGKKVSIASELNPIALLKDIDGVSEGEVATLKNLSGVLKPGFHKKFNFKQKNFVLKVSAQKVKEESGYEYFKSYKLSLSSKGKSQALLDMPHIDMDAGFPSVIWAGDIDSDGELDLLMSTSNHYNVTETTLFLSKKGSLEKQAVVFRAVGC